jgi:hypothetical protein
MSSKDLKKLEFLIRGKMGAIKNKSLTPKDSNIGVLFNKLHEQDEALYEELLKEYVVISKDVKELK